MRKLYFLFLLPLFMGGKPSAKACDCETLDTLIPDSELSVLISKGMSQVVDSFRDEKYKQLDSLNTVRDNLASELSNLKREKSKRMICRVETVPWYNGGKKVWYWYYWKYKDGELRFYKKTIKKIR